MKERAMNDESTGKLRCCPRESGDPVNTNTY